jgi:2,3-bisphosphoglycerate-independent phosphoglycerate mutase
VVELTPPHDVLDQVIAPHLPADPVLRSMMEQSYRILADHPINKSRRERGLKPANCCWFWGAGTKPALPSFYEKTGKKGMMISAVDLLKGIAVGSGMGVAMVEGANGGLHTNYAGKTEAALTALLEDHYDFAYIHVEAPDEMGHQGSLERKITAIEYLDERVITPLVERMDQSGQQYRLLIMPDHPTPIRLRTHTAEPVPFLFYDSNVILAERREYNEYDATESGNFIAQGHQIIDILLMRP